MGSQFENFKKKCGCPGGSSWSACSEVEQLEWAPCEPVPLAL